MKGFWVLLLLLPCVLGATIEQAEVDAVMSPNLVNVSVTYQVSSQSNEDIALSLPPDAFGINFYYNGAERDCQELSKEEELRVRCGSVDSSGTAKLSYLTRSLIGKLDKQNIFKFTDKLPFKAGAYSFTLQLPEGYIIPKENKKEFYLSPNPDEITSDGQRIIIKWSDRDVTRFSNFAIIERIIPESSFSGVFYLLAGALAAACTAIVILLWKRKQEPVDDLTPGFIEAEQKVVDLLKQAENNELWQKTLLKECDFSKAKLSRIVRNLEARGVVSKEAFGNTNKIKLKKPENTEE